MLPLSPILFLSAARSLAASRQSWRKMGNARVNRDSLVQTLRDRHQPGDAEDMAAFVAHVGYISHPMSEGGTFWPFPLMADCDRLHELATQWNVIRVGTPLPGDLYLRKARAEGHFTRVSIVLTALHKPTAADGNGAYDCVVLEGAAELLTVSHRIDPLRGRVVTAFGAEVLWARKTRVWAVPSFGDEFIAWVDLDERNLIGTAVPGRAA